MKTADREDIIAPVRRWLERVVIGENLCPFARPVRDRIHYAVSSATEMRGLIGDLATELQRLVDSPADALPTTVLIVPHMLADFEEYLDMVEIAETVVADAGLEGELQVASFHPDYRFADSEEDDPANFTNRAPYPLLHLLREDAVSRAVDNHPDPEAIPTRNVEHFREMGIDGVRALLDQSKRG